MSVIRVDKNMNYTCMSNEHLRDKTLSLKAKGMLSLVLSLPDAWKYSIRGLASICKESVGCISSVLKELEAAGYLTRSQLRDENGRLKEMEYVFHETSNKPDQTETVEKAKKAMQTGTVDPSMEKPCTENPVTVTPDMEDPYTGKEMQSNNNESNMNIQKTEKSNHSVIKLPGNDEEKSRVYSEMIRENIAYDRLTEEYPEDKEILAELFTLMRELVTSPQKTIVISRREYPAELVKSKLLKLKEEHIRSVMERLKENLPRVLHKKNYMMTVLFNAINDAGYHNGDRRNREKDWQAHAERKARAELVRKLIEKDGFG